MVSVAFTRRFPIHLRSRVDFCPDRRSDKDNWIVPMDVRPSACARCPDLCSSKPEGQAFPKWSRTFTQVNRKASLFRTLTGFQSNSVPLNTSTLFHGLNLQGVNMGQKSTVTHFVMDDLRLLWADRDRDSYQSRGLQTIWFWY